jgi:prepilin-type N-terminal cleavage/methylation domain-containing protein
MFKRLNNQEGFTLIELVAVVIILSILAVVAIPRYFDLETGAKRAAINTAVNELNSRDSLIYYDLKIDGMYIDDSAVWTQMKNGEDNPDLGPGYEWQALSTPEGGSFIFRGVITTVSRAESTVSAPARWWVKP